MNLSLIETEFQIVGAAIESRHALEIALNLLPPNPFRSSPAYFLSGVFYLLANWLEKGEFDEEQNREHLLSIIRSGEWPVEVSARPALEADDRLVDDVQALEECFCPTPGVAEYITELCREQTRDIQRTYGPKFRGPVNS